MLTRKHGWTHNVWPTVGVNVKPDPILAAAIICTAHPQSTEATLAMLPIVLESVERLFN